MITPNKNVRSVFKAIIVGHLCVTLPNLIFTAFIFTQWRLFPSKLLGFIVGFVCGWLYWAVTVPIWRKWALKNVTDEKSLYRWAFITALTYKKGSILEKTEISFNKKDKLSN